MIDQFKGRSERIDHWLERQVKPYFRRKSKDDPLWAELENIIHFLESESAPRKINKVSFLQAKALTDVWFKKLQSRKITQTEDENAVKVVFADGPYEWVQLQSQKSYDREGSKMGHCVASYFSQKEVLIYSLRDEENEPHCTIEIKGSKILQIKGRGNREAIPKYHYAIRKFINFLNLPVATHDAWKYGWLILKTIDGDKAVPEDELPDEVVIDWSHDVIKLSAAAKIPRVMKVHSVKVSNQKNLDLSQWEIKSRLELENCENVTLPQRLAENLDLRLTKVKFAKEYQRELKDQEIKVNVIKLVNTRLEAKKITATIAAEFEFSKIKTQELKATNQLEVKSSEIESEVFEVKTLNKTTSLPFTTFKKVKKIITPLLTVTDDLVPELHRIYVNATSSVDLQTTVPFEWPAHWGTVHFVQVKKEHLTTVDFANLKIVNVIIVGKSGLIIAKKPGINIRHVLDNPEIIEKGQSTETYKIKLNV